MKRYLALLVLVAITFANATVYLKVEDGKVLLQKVEGSKTITNAPSYLGKVISSKLTLVDTLTQKPCCVSEVVHSTSSLELRGALIKEGNIAGSFSAISNSTYAQLNARMKGSLMVLFFYIQNSDIRVVLNVDKENGVGTLNVDGFLTLPAPKITVNSMLRNNLIPFIEKTLKKLDLQYKISYKLKTPKGMPVPTTVYITISVKGEKDKLLSILKGLNQNVMSNLERLINSTSSVVRHVEGNFTIKVKLSKSGETLMSIMTSEANANGKYYKDTVARELKYRLQAVLMPLGAEKLTDYLINTTKAEMKLTITYKNKELNTVARAEGVAFKNTPEFWNEVQNIIKNSNVKVVVECNGHVYTNEWKACLPG